jgi:hypothetical protein
MTYITRHQFVDNGSVQVDVSQQKIFLFLFFFLYVLNLIDINFYGSD